MGTIQSSVNQITGTLMGAAVAGKHLAQQKKSVAEQKEANEVLEQQMQKQDLKDELEFTEKGQELNKETEQTIDAFNENLKNEIDLENQMTGLHSTISDKKLRTSKGQFFSNKALQEMQDRQNEITLQKQRLDTQIKMLDKKREIYQELGGNF